MAQMNWGMVCSVPEDEDLEKLREFGNWFTANVHKYGLQNNQLYNFAEKPDFVTRLENNCPEGGDGANHMDTVYENLCRTHPAVSFVIHILPKKNSPEFEKLKHLTCRLSLIGQGILLENAHSKFAGADEASVFNSINQYIARRFAQIVDFKSDKKERISMLIKRPVVPLKGRVGRCYHVDDLSTTVSTVLHSDKMVKLAQTQHDSKHFRNSAIVCGLPEHFTRYQVAAIFARWPVASVLLTTRSCAFIDFFDPNGPYKAKSYFDEVAFKDPETGVEYHISVCPIQSRYLRFRQPHDVTVVPVKRTNKEKRVAFRDTTNRPIVHSAGSRKSNNSTPEF